MKRFWEFCNPVKTEGLMMLGLMLVGVIIGDVFHFDKEARVIILISGGTLLGLTWGLGILRNSVKEEKQYE